MNTKEIDNTKQQKEGVTHMTMQEAVIKILIRITRTSLQNGWSSFAQTRNSVTVLRVRRQNS